MRNYLSVVLAVVACVATSFNAYAKPKASLEREAMTVVDEYLSKYKPLDLALRAAWYKYATTGDKKASQREAELTLALRKLNSDSQRFKKLTALYKNRNKLIDCPILKREVEVIYLAHLPNQVSEDKLKRLTELEKKLKEGFNDYRAEVDGKKLSPVDVSHILSESTNSQELEKVWKSQQSVGTSLEFTYRELVNLRNEVARELGFKNALELSTAANEMDLKMLDRFYADVRKATDAPFKRLKEKYIDPRLAKRLGISEKDLMPWHYQNAFFQEAPTSIFGSIDLDSLYKKTDSNKIIKQAKDFYTSMGIDVGGIVKNSSLFPKPGKNQHAVAWFLNPEKQDSSVLIMSLPNPPQPPKASEVATLVHELSHDINFEAILKNKELPYLLRETPMLTEAVAMLFENQTQTADWFTRLGISPDKAKEAVDSVELIDYAGQLIFLRWAANIYCFESKFYADPSHDIGDTWWKCREQNQFLRRPAGWKNPDALAKYHIPNVEPLYYSNYAIGSVANVQFADLVAGKIGQDARSASYFDKKDLGNWLMADFLAQGRRYRWDDFIKRTTGKPLSVSAWKKFYLKSGIEKKLF